MSMDYTYSNSVLYYRCLCIGSVSAAADKGVFFFLAYEACIRPKCGVRLCSAVQLNLISYKSIRSALKFLADTGSMCDVAAVLRYTIK